MPKITYIDSSGTTRTVTAENGATVMETAIRNNVPGIEAECGGPCACATCHVYIDDAWRAKTGEPSPMEEDMLDFGKFKIDTPIGTYNPDWALIKKNEKT